MRSRYGQGDGSDLSRIDRQQVFLGAMLRKVMSGEIMSSPSSIYAFLSSVTDSITVDDQFTVDKMTDIAIQMREVDMSNIRFVTVPNGAHPDDANRVAWTQPDADRLFQAIANDTEITDEKSDDEEKDEEKEDVPPSTPPKSRWRSSTARPPRAWPARWARSSRHEGSWWRARATRRGRFPGGPPSSTVPVWRRTPTRSPRR